MDLQILPVRTYSISIENSMENMHRDVRVNYISFCVWCLWINSSFYLVQKYTQIFVFRLYSLILPLAFKLVMRIWRKIKIITSTWLVWVFSLPVHQITWYSMDVTGRSFMIITPGNWEVKRKFQSRKTVKRVINLVVPNNDFVSALAFFRTYCL